MTSGAETTASRWLKYKPLAIEAGIVVAIVLVLLFVMPAVLSGFRLELLGRFLAFAILALALDLIWGYAGLLSLGHGVFFGLGGYAIAMHLKLQIPPEATSRLPDFMGLYDVKELPWFWHPFAFFPFAVAAALILPALVGAILGYTIFRNRIRGVYFSILTQATTIIFFNFFNGQQKLFNGTNGLTDFKTIFGVSASAASTKYVFYALTVISLVLTYALCRWLTGGVFGRLLVAMRDDENRVRFSGYNPTSYKVLLFAVSAAIAGLAGALYTPLNGSISPRQMDVVFSIEIAIWVAVGGRASLVGAVLGALLVNFAKSLLSEKFPEVWLFFQGGLFLVVVMALPAGVVGWVRLQGWELWQQLRGKRHASTYPSLEVAAEACGEDRET